MTEYYPTHDDALAAIQTRHQCRVQAVPVPLPARTRFYITERGDLYGIRQNRSKQAYELYKRVPNGGKYLSYEFKHGGKRIYAQAKSLLYYAFVLGEWKDSVKVTFKDCNPANLTPDNLKAKSYGYTKECGANMQRWTNEYKQSFDYVARSVAWIMMISREDAQDAAQDAFVKLSSSLTFQPSNFVALWIFNAKELAALKIARDERMTNYDNHEFRVAGNDRPYDTDILEFVESDRNRRVLHMIRVGYRISEIAAEFGVRSETVNEWVNSEVRHLRKVLMNDIIEQRR